MNKLKEKNVRNLDFKNKNIFSIDEEIKLFKENILKILLEMEQMTVIDEYYYKNLNKELFKKKYGDFSFEKKYGIVNFEKNHHFLG